LAANQIIRHVAFSKHQGSYKWPLGSVGSTHIAGHTRSVNARHEKAEKQWQEMVFKIVNPDQRPRDRTKVRLREFEKLQQHIEEAGEFGYSVHFVYYFTFPSNMCMCLAFFLPINIKNSATIVII
jgi:hypothetical protein